MTTGGASTMNPWLVGGGLLLEGIGTGLTYAEQEEQRKKQEEFEREQFDWKKKMEKGQLSQNQQQLGQNAIQQMRGNFKDALYRSLTRY